MACVSEASLVSIGADMASYVAKIVTDLLGLRFIDQLKIINSDLSKETVKAKSELESADLNRFLGCVANL